MRNQIIVILSLVLGLAGSGLVLYAVCSSPGTNAISGSGATIPTPTSTPETMVDHRRTPAVPDYGECYSKSTGEVVSLLEDKSGRIWRVEPFDAGGVAPSGCAVSSKAEAGSVYITGMQVIYEDPQKPGRMITTKTGHRDYDVLYKPDSDDEVIVEPHGEVYRLFREHWGWRTPALQPTPEPGG